jgi:hypothetical protein
MKPEQLETAMELRDRLRDLTTFLQGYEDWQGCVSIQFGSYRTLIPDSHHTDVLSILLVEKESLIKALNKLGVQMA